MKLGERGDLEESGGSGSGMRRSRGNDQMAMRMDGNLQLAEGGGQGHFQKEKFTWDRGGAQVSMRHLWL